MTRVRIYLILQTALCVLLVVLLSVTAVTIYREGVARKAERPLESIYTREIAAEKFAPIAPQIGPPTKAAWTVPRESSQRGQGSSYPVWLSYRNKSDGITAINITIRGSIAMTC